MCLVNEPLPCLSINDPITEVENETLNHEVLNHPSLQIAS